jgi:hypothetical protein
MESIQLIVSDIDTGPSEIDTILEEIIEAVIKESSKRKNEAENEDEPISKKQKVVPPPVPNNSDAEEEQKAEVFTLNNNKNIIEEVEYKFHIGVSCGGFCNERKNRRNKKQKKKKAAAPKPRAAPAKPKDIDIIERIFVKEAQLTRLFTAVNPYEVKRRLFSKVPDILEPTYDFTGKRFSLITIIIPVLKPHYLAYRLAYWNLENVRGDFFDWQIKIKQTVQDKKQPFPASTSTLPKPCERQSFGPSKYYTYATYNIFEINQQTRWRFKRLVNIWLINKAKRRIIGDDVDLVTLEQIPEKEQIRVLCLTSRSLYVYSGATLIKSFLSNLGAQVASIANIKMPKNPFTNVPFTYGQLLHICVEIGGWCYRNSKSYPPFIALFRESQFKLHVLQNLHSNYIQYKATRTFIMDDDISGEFFFENLEVMFDSYAQYLTPYGSLIETDIFREWLHAEPGHYMLKNWKQLVCDYWHYKQSDHLIRENWRGEMSILYDIEVLLKASDSNLRHYYN